jgi:uncharacterized surface protein with fasciclin (FAS1) repeats
MRPSWGTSNDIQQPHDSAHKPPGRLERIGSTAARGPFTVFAPTDEAFKRLPAGSYDSVLKDAGKLKAILNYHVVSGYLATRDLKSGEVMTLQGSPLTALVSSSEVRINGARVSNADVVAANGIIHAIDAVILPKNWPLLAAAA